MNTTTESYFFAKEGQVYPASAWKLYSYVSTDEPYDNEGHRVLIEVYDDPDNYLTIDDLSFDPRVERMAGQYIDFASLADFVDAVREQLDMAHRKRYGF